MASLAEQNFYNWLSQLQADRAPASTPPGVDPNFVGPPTEAQMNQAQAARAQNPAIDDMARANQVVDNTLSGKIPLGSVPKVQGDISDNSKTTVSRPYISTGEDANAMALAHAMLAPQMATLKAQEDGINQRQKEIDQFAQAAPAKNYSAIFQGIDALTGGKTRFAEGYKAPMSAEDRQLMALKLTQELQKERGALSGTDQKLLSYLIAKQGYTDTQSHASDLKAGYAPPPGSGPKSPKDDSQKQAQDYNKVVADIQPLIDKAHEIQKLLPTVRDFGEQTPTGKAGMFGLYTLNQNLGTDFALTEDQQRYRQLQKEIAAFQQLAQSGKQSSDKEFARLANMIGGLEFSSKQQFSKGLNDVLGGLQGRVKSAAITYPKGVARFRDQGGVTPESFKGSQVTLPKAPAFQKKDTSKMTLEEKKAYLEELTKAGS